MARVTIAQSEKMSQALKGLRIFKFEPGNSYRYIFPADENGEIILYATPVHSLNMGTQSGTSKCVKDYVVSLPNGDLQLDQVTGKPVNDGTCPYCEIQILGSRIVGMKMDAWREKYPQATDKEIKEKFKEYYNDVPVQRAHISRGFIVARIASDKTGMDVKIQKDSKIPDFEIGFLTLTENQFDKKYKPAVVQYENKPAWFELMFVYPEADTKMESAKDMSIAPTMKQTLEIYPELKESITNALKEFDLDSVEEKVYSFRPESIGAIERKLASKQSALMANLTDEQKAELQDSLSKKVINAEASTLEDIFALAASEDYQEEQGEHEEHEVQENQENQEEKDSEDISLI